MDHCITGACSRLQGQATAPANDAAMRHAQRCLKLDRFGCRHISPQLSCPRRQGGWGPRSESGALVQALKVIFRKVVAKMPALTRICPISWLSYSFGSNLIHRSENRGGAEFGPKALEAWSFKCIWPSKAVQTWKSGMHYVWPQPEHEGSFKMLSGYACQVWGPRCAGSGSGRAVTAGGVTQVLCSGQPASALAPMIENCICTFR
eukprot:1159631-Pelagomonas_calceolata.AAC.12